MADSMSTDEQIGFHKGSLNTLLAERTELAKMVGIVDSLIQAHAHELQKLGVKLTTDQPVSSQKLDDKLKK
jgi:biotin operon repressor